MAKVVMLDPEYRIPLVMQPARSSMFDVHRDMTLSRFYAQVASYVGNANTIALSPICTSESPGLISQRLYSWKTLHESMIRIAEGLNAESLVSKQDIVAQAYAPVISKHAINAQSVVLVFGVYKPVPT